VWGPMPFLTKSSESWFTDRRRFRAVYWVCSSPGIVLIGLKSAKLTRPEPLSPQVLRLTPPPHPPIIQSICYHRRYPSTFYIINYQPVSHSEMRWKYYPFSIYTIHRDNATQSQKTSRSSQSLTCAMQRCFATLSVFAHCDHYC